MKHGFIYLASALFLLTGCISEKSPVEVEGLLNKWYVGRPANEFFAQYGLADGEFEHKEGNNAYVWTSVTRASNHSSITHYSAPNGNVDIADTYTGTAVKHYCELRIYADQHDIIQRFAVAVDTNGQLSSSTCSEIFY